MVGCSAKVPCANVMVQLIVMLSIYASRNSVLVFHMYMIEKQSEVAVSTLKAIFLLSFVSTGVDPICCGDAHAVM